MTARHVLESGEGREVSERAGLKDAHAYRASMVTSLMGPDSYYTHGSSSEVEHATLR